MGLRPPISVEPGSCACDEKTRSCLCLPSETRISALQAAVAAARFKMDAASKAGDRAAAAHHRAHLRAALAELAGTERPAPATPAPKRDSAHTPTLEQRAAARLREQLAKAWQG